MQVVLEIIEGPNLGKKAVVRAGQIATFGRTERADFAFPLDPHMSGLHFAVDLGSQNCCIRDLQSGNGTFLNGNRIQEAVLHEADVILAGKTSFAVHVDAVIAEAPVIPDYLKGIVPPDWRGEMASPAPQAEMAFEPPTQSWPTESPAAPTWEPPRPDVQPVLPSFLPPQPPPVPVSQPVPATGVSASMSGTLRLVIEATAGPHAGTRASLRAGDSLTVGRTDRADLVLDFDSGLSGLHFSIHSTPRGFEIRDLGSSNGTLLNGETVAATLLVDGDQIRAGHSRFGVRLEGSPAAVSTELPGGGRLSPAEGLLDADPRVRREAMLAAVWTGQPWLIAHCRKLAESPVAENWDAIHMLAVLGKPAELARIEAICHAADLGPRRYLVCGAFGHPALVGGLLTAMSGIDPAVAAVAGLAYRKITGADIATSRRAEVLLQEGNPPAEIVLPDVRRATDHWRQAQGQFSGSTRVCRGFDLSDSVSVEAFAELDMESRWETLLRSRYSSPSA